MKFFLRTGWGESTTYIGGCISRILHGLCQGNGAVPGSWLLLRSVLISLMKRLGHEVVLVSPIGKEELRLWGITYVDDADLFAVAEPGTAHESL